jgi:molybdenum cofactor biosynthesis enzyme MoaA
MQDELSHSKWLELIQECKNLGVKNFILTGGEPFLYGRWPDLIEACGSNVRVVISTNGKHFTECNLAVFVPVLMDWLRTIS